MPREIYALWRHGCLVQPLRIGDWNSGYQRTRLTSLARRKRRRGGACTGKRRKRRRSVAFGRASCRTRIPVPICVERYFSIANPTTGRKVGWKEGRQGNFAFSASVFLLLASPLPVARREQHPSVSHC